MSSYHERSTKGSTSQHWTVVPGANGISLNFDQWYKLTSLESLFAIEHLKALAKVPVILKAKKRPRSPSSPPPHPVKTTQGKFEVGHTARHYYPGDNQRRRRRNEADYHYLNERYCLNINV